MTLLSKATYNNSFTHSHTDGKVHPPRETDGQELAVALSEKMSERGVCV